MPSVLIALSVIFFSYAEAKDLEITACHQVFSQMSDAVTDLYIDTKKRLVLWKGEPVVLSDTRLRILNLIVGADDVISVDDLLEDMYGARGGGDDPTGTLKTQISQIRMAFRVVDPEFDQIKSKRRGGYYWHRDPSEIDTIVRGPLRMARNLYQAWWNEEVIHLMPAEHTILMRLLQRGDLGLSRKSFQVHHASDCSLRMTVSRLNQKFQPFFADTLIVSSGWGIETGKIRFNVKFDR